jgi:chemotaxis protein CheZ
MIAQENTLATDPPSYRRDQVVSIINSVLGKINNPQELSRGNLLQELTGLKGIIENLRSQLHAAQPDDISNTHIPSAAEELNAIISTTEEATETIMESCETILDSIKDVSAELHQTVESNIVKIYEACTFQDLTGQRIKKVSTSLAQIDQKVSAIIGMLQRNLDIKTASGNGVSKLSTPVVDPLLNGPALPQNAVSQDDIDRILAELGKA